MVSPARPKKKFQAYSDGAVLRLLDYAILFGVAALILSGAVVLLFARWEYAVPAMAFSVSIGCFLLLRWRMRREVSEAGWGE